MSKPRSSSHAHRAIRVAALALCLAAFGQSRLRWEPGPGHRSAALPVPATGHTGFTLLDAASIGIDFTNALAPERVQAFQNLMNGAGLAAADVNGDGLVDLYFVHREGRNQLFLNLGEGRFTNATAGSGAACTNLVSTGAVFADVNGDGSPDLLVSSFGGPHALLLNDGKGHFSDVTASSGIGGKSGSTSLALADLDGDGALDLYWCNFAVQAILRDGGMITTRMINGQPQVTGRHANRLRIVDGTLYEYGDPDVLYHNDGKGHFTPVPWESAFIDGSGRPVPPPPDFGLAVQIRDVNGDGFPDIYVCNDFQTPDHLWLGDGKGHFREAPDMALRNMSYASMGVDFADLDRDGRMDFITVEMLDPDLRKHLRTIGSAGPNARSPGQYRNREDLPRNALYRNRGDGTYAEIANFSGVAATSWSWTPLFLDVDLDGWEDLLVSNGHLHDVNNRDITAKVVPKPGQSLQATKDQLLSFPPLEPPKFAFRNRHDLTFENTSEQWGFDTHRMAHGMIAVDLDEDGDMDIVANTLRGPPLVFRNESIAPRVAVRVKGLAPNTGGIGARITLRGGPVTQTQEIVAGGQYLSHGEMQRTFAAGTGPMTLEVRWRSGRRSEVTGVRANRIYEIDETGAADGPPEPKLDAVPPLFADVSALLGHAHVEDAFDDFEQQPLLPQRYSQLGPGVAWSDIDGDGHVDLAIGSGKGGPISVFAGDGKGGFAKVRESAPVPEDAGALLAMPEADGRHSVIAAIANYVSGGESNAPAALRFVPRDGVAAAFEPLAGNSASFGALAAGDVDGDGDLDVFAGARLTARRWPQPGGSIWFRNDGGKLVRDEAASAPFAAVGPVADALLVDLDGDGKPELVLACELGPVRVFHRDASGWKETDPGVDTAGIPGIAPGITRLRALEGWWNSVAAADFDGDGRMDLVVGNRGRNSSWETWGDHLPRVEWADGGDGSVAVVEGVMETGVVRPVRARNVLGGVLQDLATRYPTHALFAEADTASILGVHAPRTPLKAATLASVVLLNRGDHFEARALPPEAQWAPAFGLAAADFDGDGNTDLFVAQNLFAVRRDDPRLDAGRGLLLSGDGRGGFRALTGEESGVVLYGEQRGAAAADYDGDGRVDLVVSQNGGQTALFHNLRAKPGLRVRLRGAAGNPDAIGAVVRPMRGGVGGAAQAITAGGGYWSQPDVTLVFGGARPEKLEIRWPGGKTGTIEVPADAREIAVTVEGAVKRP